MFQFDAECRLPAVVGSEEDGTLGCIDQSSSPTQQQQQQCLSDQPAASVASTIQACACPVGDLAADVTGMHTVPNSPLPPKHTTRHH